MEDKGGKYLDQEQQERLSWTCGRNRNTTVAGALWLRGRVKKEVTELYRECRPLAACIELRSIWKVLKSYHGLISPSERPLWLMCERQK